jgi:hypothetical protein
MKNHHPSAMGDVSVTVFLRDMPHTCHKQIKQIIIICDRIASALPTIGSPNAENNDDKRHHASQMSGDSVTFLVSN